MAVNEPFERKELVQGDRGCVSDSQDAGEESCASSQVRKLSCVLPGVLHSLLERILLHNKA